MDNIYYIKKFLQPFFQDETVLDDFLFDFKGDPKAEEFLQIIYRFTTLADEYGNLEQGRSSMAVVFLISLAESVAKIVLRTNGSRQSVSKFFEYLSDDDFLLLQNEVKLHPQVNNNNLTREEIVDIFYNIRNKVLHEGILEFNFGRIDSDTEVMKLQSGSYEEKRNLEIIMPLTYETFRNIVVRTALRVLNKTA